MTDIKQYLVAMCLVFIGKSPKAVSGTLTDPRDYGTVKIKWCDGNLICSSQYMNYYPDEVRDIEIGNTELIPAYAFRNAEYLRYVKGVNKNIRILASNSFFNLPAVEKIDLSFNLIRYIHYGVFVNVSVTELNLSWNRIIYIEEKSLHGLRNLETLDLSHNEIPTFYNLPSISPVQTLNLSYNFLGEIQISKEIYPNLTVLDLSFNSLEGFFISSDTPMKKIDLTRNSLRELNAFDIVAVEELRIALNEFIRAPDNLYSGSRKIRKIALYPNTWKCDELGKLWERLHKHGTTLLRSDDDYRLAARNEASAICYMDYGRGEILLENVLDDTTRKTFHDISIKFIKDNHTPCDEDHMCSDEEVCRNQKCYNPCKRNVCDFTSLCKAEKHTFQCDCPKHQKRNPKDFDSRCYTAECFSADDCPEGSICKYHLCQKGDLIEFQ